MNYLSKLIAMAFAFLGLASSANAAVTVDETAILADITSVGGSGVTIALAVAAFIIGMGLVKKLIR